jgi:uncharacterized membrane protein (Fun14 family)
MSYNQDIQIPHFNFLFFLIATAIGFDRCTGFLIGYFIHKIIKIILFTVSEMTLLNVFTIPRTNYC